MSKYTVLINSKEIVVNASTAEKAAEMGAEAYDLSVKGYPIANHFSSTGRYLISVRDRKGTVKKFNISMCQKEFYSAEEEIAE